MFSLSGKIALITGAGSGIGAAIAHTFAQAGARVIATDLHGDTAQATAAQLAEFGAVARQLDIADERQVQTVSAELLAEHGVVDILVNNAGIGHAGTLPNTEAADLDRLYQVNVRGAFLMCNAYLPAMLARKSGVVVNLASIAGLVAVRERLAYTVTKHAIVGLTRALALDHAAEGVRVNCICPGRVETPWIAERLRETPDPERAYAEMCATQPMGRMGRPEEIAAAALYLASDEAAFVTGATLTPDGGWSAG